MEELSTLIDHKDTLIQELQIQLQNSIRPETLREKIEGIVQREVEERLRMGDSGSSSNNTVQFLEKKLKIADDTNDSLKTLLHSKDDETERILAQKVALTNIFENDLLQMTDKVITQTKNVRTQEELEQVAADMMNLQKLIAVSFQALKSSMQKPHINNMPLQKSKKENTNNVVITGTGDKIPTVID